jgi:hypothetical protein
MQTPPAQIASRGVRALAVLHLLEEAADTRPGLGRRDIQVSGTPAQESLETVGGLV